MNGIVYYNYCCEEHKKLLKQQYARVAQLVERDLAKVEAAGSSPVSRSFYFLRKILPGIFSVFYTKRKMCVIVVWYKRKWEVDYENCAW